MESRSNKYATTATYSGAPATMSNINNPYAQPKYSVLTIFQKLMNGEMPSNNELNFVLESAQRVVVREGQSNEIGLNPHEKIILADIKELLLDAELLISQKNSNERWQQFFARHLSPTTPTSTTAQIIPKVTGNERIQTGQPALKIGSQVKQSLSFWASTIQTLVMSVEFRSLLLDLLRFVQDIWHQEMQKHSQNVGEDLKQELRSTEEKTPKETAQKVAPKVRNIVKGVSSDIRTGNIDVDPAQRDLLLQRFRDTLRRLAQNQNFHRAMNSIFILIDNLVSEASKLKSDVDQASGRNVAEVPRSMWLDFCDILDDYMGKKYMGRFNSDFATLYGEVKGDHQTVSWFKHLKRYIQNALTEPESLQDERVIREMEDIWTEGRNVGQKWSNSHMIQRVSKDIQKIFNRLRDDALTTKILNDTRNFTNHMFRDETGNVDLQNTWEGLRILRFLMVPMIWEQLENFPIPKMEGETPKYKYMFDEMYLRGHSIVPKDVDLKFKNHSVMNFHDTPLGKSYFQMTLRLSNLNLKMDNVKFYLKKKRGFPKFEDSGRLNLTAKGYENFLVIKWVVESERGKPLFFRTKSVVSKISEVTPKFTEGNHKRAFNSLTGIFGKTAMRKQVNDSIEAKIIGVLDQVNARLNEFAAQRWESNRNRWLTKPTGISGIVERKKRKNKAPKKLRTRVKEAIVGPTTGSQSKQEVYEGDRPSYASSGVLATSAPTEGVYSRSHKSKGVALDSSNASGRGVSFDQSSYIGGMEGSSAHVRPHVITDNDRIVEDIERRHSSPRIITTPSEIITPPAPVPSRVESSSGMISRPASLVDQPSSSVVGSQPAFQPKEKEIFIETPSDMNKMSGVKSTGTKSKSTETRTRATTSIAD